jgi:hypothetical protein
MRLLLALGLIVVLAVALRTSHALENVGLLGSCRVVSPGGGSQHEWRACEAGKLGGHPDLSGDSCIRWTVVGPVEYWSCPVRAGKAARS